MTADTRSDVTAAPAVAKSDILRSKLPFYRKAWFRIVVYAALMYILWCAFICFRQDKMLFLPDLVPRPPATPNTGDAVVMTIEIPKGGTVEGWFFPAGGSNAGSLAPAVVYFHGNAEIIDEQDRIVQAYRSLGCAVLLPEYRGYGRSAGKPSQKAIAADAVVFYDALIERPDVDTDRIVFHGRSVGGGVAADLASRRQPAALILESTFTSIASMAWQYGLPPFLARHPFRNDRVVAQVDIPILILHGTKDRIIPVKHGRKLRDLARDVGYVEYDCGHNDFPGSGNEADYRRQIRKFLTRAGILE